jgi:16S rRNA (cytosine1402-N4)-methyltransferase
MGNMEHSHTPVLVEEVLMLLDCRPGRTYVDATLGGGGHALEILKRSAPDGALVGLEWDEEALSAATERLAEFGDRVRIVRESYVRLPDVLNAIGIREVDGILLDLGVSSFQLDRRERGFSLRGEAALDMRMDQRLEVTAADLVNGMGERELERTLLDYGEERWARRIARAIVREREREPIRTTQTLRKIILGAIPSRFHSHRIDPATRTFQALRIRVNDELENLRQILETAWGSLRHGGRMCVISFHSLEDRIVKVRFRTLEKESLQESGSGPSVQILTKKPVTASEEERQRNPRSRSAKLRCAEKT